VEVKEAGERGTIPIVALDFPDRAQALGMVARLGSECSYYKIGGELFTAEGPAIVRAVVEAGARVFLDLKFHDIPNTVKASARSAAKLGASLVTVHASGGRKMMQAAVEGAGEGCGVLAVTVLTSMDGGALGEAWGRTAPSVREEVLRLSDLAREAGALGIVCSGEEAEAIRARHGDGLRTLVPGIRMSGGASHDQVRVVSPEEAVAAGASYIVVGRAVTGDPNPVAAMTSINQSVRMGRRGN
jgi:orotidine-5'-phosphate decarboxylase